MTRVSLSSAAPHLFKRVGQLANRDSPTLAKKCKPTGSFPHILPQGT